MIQSRDLSETLVLSESLSLLFYLLNFKAAMSAVCLLYVMGSYAMTGVGTPPPLTDLPTRQRSFDRRFQNCTGLKAGIDTRHS